MNEAGKYFSWNFAHLYLHIIPNLYYICLVRNSLSDHHANSREEYCIISVCRSVVVDQTRADFLFWPPTKWQAFLHHENVIFHEQNYRLIYIYVSIKEHDGPEISGRTIDITTKVVLLGNDYVLRNCWQCCRRQL